MREDERIWAVKELLLDYMRSPSLQHLRDPLSVSKLAKQILERIDQGHGIWRKWDGQRELVLKSALGCWIPAEDLRDFLNAMPGPPLTATDVGQRMRTMEEEEGMYPHDEHKEGCLALYAKEKAEGTELAAIIGCLREYIDQEDDRLRREREAQYERSREEARIAAEQRLLSGADCPWTQLRGSLHFYCRKNGRTYRVSPGDDKRWELYRVKAVADDEKGDLLGRYQRRGEATKVVAEVAEKPEPRW